MEMQVIFHLMLQFQLNRPDVLADVPAMLLSSTGPSCFEMELCTKNDPMVFKIYYEFHN